MRFPFAAFFGVFAASAVIVASACIPELITDAPVEGSEGSSEVCGNPHVAVPDEECDPGGSGEGGAATVIGCDDTCHVECVDGGVIDSRTDHCYFAVDPSTSLNDGENSAEQTCQRQGAHVVTFADDLERAFVLTQFGSTLHLGAGTAFWIGLSLDPARAALVPVNPETKEPGWSPTCSGCYAPSDVDGSIPRLVLDAGGSCVLDVSQGLSQGGWSQFPCSQIPAPGIPVLCEREPVGDFWQQCNGGFCARIHETASTKRYLFSFAPATADDARGACADLGGFLAVFDSRQERESLVRSLLHHYDVLLATDTSIAVPQEAWIGFSTAGDDGGAFAWNDDGGFVGSPWGDNQPTADASLPARAYAILNADDYDVQLAHDENQGTARPYICQY